MLSHLGRYVAAAPCGVAGVVISPSRPRDTVCRSQIFKEGVTEEGVDHVGLYGRRPIADEPPHRLACLPPSLLLYGDKDWVWTPSVRQAAEGALPSCTLHVIERGNHHLYLDLPEVFHTLVEEALRD
mmetsp:Transcript_8718/g.24192  ORF Transcript_8718/g.24192 Transcript_8718/m.24192 type:complete len:127 (-) Transcript_8718:274-654(-)